MPRYLSSDEVSALVGPADIIAALRDGFRRGAHFAPRQKHEVGDDSPASLLMMAAWAKDVGRVVKIMSAVPANATRGLPTSAEVLSLFDPVTGELLLTLNSTSLTNLRTAAASALAADYLAAPDAKTLAVFATGPLAPSMAHAHATVRDYRQMIVWGRDAGRAAATADQISRLLPDVQVTSTTDGAAAANAADVITAATRSTTPILQGAWLRPGTHVDLVGGYTPDMREADDDVMRGAQIWLDERAAGLTGPGDIVQPLRSGAITGADIAGDLFDMVRSTAPLHDGRTSVFKSVGCALEDLYAARKVYDVMQAKGDNGV